MKKLHVFARLAGVCSCFCALGLAASGPFSSSDDPESFHVELTGSAWLLDSSGTIQASGTPVDLVTDLGAEQRQLTFYGRLVVKPGRKHRIILEGTPVRLTGFNVVNRTITYRGQTFNVSDTLRSSADFNYFFAGYQYDLVSGPRGHFGLSVGGAYLNATGTIQSVDTNTVATKSETLGLPLAGAEGRFFLLPRSKFLMVEGGARGMGVGSYGHYIEATGSGGLALGEFAFLAGYRWADVDLHDTSSSQSGVDVRFKGPIFSLEWRK